MSNSELKEIPNTPSHVAIIMDGNGRWAKQHKRHRIFGHKNGVTAVKSVVEGAAEMGIKNLTLYAFSTENWNRPKEEVNALMQLLISSIHNERKTLIDKDIRLLAIGDLSNLPSKCNKELQEAMRRTADNKRMNLVLALSYSARWEITQAIKKLADDIKSGNAKPEDIDEALIHSYMATAGIPDPELLIRTSGEKRISNFLLWQLAYTELYFTEKLWPDFRKEDLKIAVEDYLSRERRFGKISEQLTVE